MKTIIPIQSNFNVCDVNEALGQLQSLPTDFNDPTLSKLCQDTKDLLINPECYKLENRASLMKLLTQMQLYTDTYG